ncbi:hypothetical protein [Gramella sp. AN32]|uniref:Uncharacterized protein n=1 Tax=Christiangramia antarctica TaxID=2058158 RepID=A0ABW5X1H8_9FLAO|nr:hypothetical protein [Gramella sp. AN32]MCM4156737.1 hypothetical protein [Gramella sp. AN32]
MFELGKLYIPTQLVFDPVTKTISFRMSEIYSEAYFDKIQYSLELKILGSEVVISYYGEDDTYLFQVLNLDEDCIACGSLENASLGAIQEKALKVLQGYMLDPKKELFHLFNEMEGEFPIN